MLPRVPSLLPSSKKSPPLLSLLNAASVLLQQEQLVLCIAVVGEFSKPASAYNGVCNSIPFVHLSCEYSLKINILALLLVCRAGAGSGANPSGIADDAVTKAREKLNEGKARFGDLFKGKVNRAVWIPPNCDYIFFPFFFVKAFWSNGFFQTYLKHF
jgi:hypothetical protein